MVNVVARAVQRGIEAAFGVRITRTLPRGVDPLFDVSTILAKTRMGFVVDVGAHVGVNALRFRRAWPQAEIHCYEPSPQNFKNLQAAVAGRRIYAHRTALGDKDAAAVIEPGVTSDMDMVDETRQYGEAVVLRRLDSIVPTERINYLKIDTEGSDLKVLQGAHQLLSDRRIDVIELEAGVRRSRRLIPFGDFQTFLEPYGYHLFGFYEQVDDWARGWHRLRRANLLFVSEPVIRANAWTSGYEDQVERID